MTEQKPPKKKGKPRFHAYFISPDASDETLQALFEEMKKHDPLLGTAVEPPPEQPPTQKD